MLQKLFYISLSFVKLDYFFYLLCDFFKPIVPGHVFSCVYLILLVLPLLFQVELSTLQQFYFSGLLLF